MSIHWKEFEPVIVTKDGLEVEGFINTIDKKSGLIHVHTDRGPVTLYSGSKAVRRVEPEDDSAEEV